MRYDLIFNVDKIKVLILDFRKCRNFKHSKIINGSAIEQVDIHKFLDLTATNTLSWTQDTDEIIEKGRRRMFFLRIVKLYNVSITVMNNFYRAVNEAL